MDDIGLWEYLENFIKPALEDYVGEDRTIEDLVLDLPIENTSVFNYRNGQSVVYNRLKRNQVLTLKELFESYDSGSIDYGADFIGGDFYIHDEIHGVVELLKYRFLREFPKRLSELLNYSISYDDKIFNKQYGLYGYPGDVVKTVVSQRMVDEESFQSVDGFYRVLKSCGFDHTSTKVLIDAFYSANSGAATVGQFLGNLPDDFVENKFKNMPQEYKTFKTVLGIIRDFQEEYVQSDTKSSGSSKK